MTQTSTILTAVMLFLPFAAMAQSTGTVTRAQVRADLIAIEQAGYKPGVQDPDYPAKYQAAEARVAARNAPNQMEGYGVPAAGSSQAGHTGTTGQN
ncbi:DUF4148 domain-containing protein [Paraburkholderia sp. C35]|uniref:DUF4148 domain-containing protein n=1 Tax=Paraburkholderia sp. C35 TaxID=2126993 RepID=UPI0023B8185E|nr:DUF4148 domain-containing protein [Paraburkholderia sp. C35]